MDSSEIAEDFRDALEDLKSNSKAEIDNLTVIAKENTAHAQALCKVLEQHIKTTRPEWKLPALLVLDSLVRHIGPPYSTYLGQNLFQTFMNAYTQVTNATRRDMEAVFRTWKQPRTGSRDTSPVLAHEITFRIENALDKIGALNQQPRTATPPMPLPLPLPPQNSVSAAYLLKELQSHTPQTFTPPPPRIFTPPPLPQIFTPPPQPAPTIPTFPSQPMAAPIVPPSALLAALRQAGLSSLPVSAVPATPAPPALAPALLPTGPSGISLTNESIRVRRPHLIAQLYQHNPNQCKQCGRRFPSTTAGSDAKLKHLDWHFSVKTRISDNTTVNHRSAYLDEIEWTQLRESSDDAERPLNTAEETQKEDVWVPMPSNSALHNVPCSICMEKFVTVWHATAQQPVWMDAVLVGGKYYHASCYEEVHGGSGSGGRGLPVRNGGRSGEPAFKKRKF
ncbi:hypothetical protein BT63DRAFT_422642 [Microthyrium microscopicum]|uniref:CID domain-containing protein n=1 Tax=Microthyrium microscopicum TaxID=703497 RepID=A0A6A6UIL8_9PEZI|nr:hypothetical protein BT63DRAFT_422642 [Microthyrium microscopicum]